MVDGLLERCRTAGAAIRARADPHVDAVLAAVDVAAVVFTVRGRFARRHVLADARRHLLKTLRGQEFSRGLDDYIADRALAAHGRQSTVVQPGRRTPAADQLFYTADFAEPDRWWIAGADGKPPRESSRYERVRVASLAVQNAIRAARPAPAAQDDAPAATAAVHSGAFTFTRLLELPDRDLVARTVTNHLHAAAHGPLEALRARTRPEDCTGGPTFSGAKITADAGLVVDGLLIDFKSARHPLKEMSQRTAWQLTGYLLLDTADRYRIDTVGLYLSRSGVLTSWPVDDFLALLGACRRDLTELRGVFGELLTGCRGQADARYFGTPEETERVRQLLERLAPVAGTGCCPVCTQPLPESIRCPGSPAPPGVATGTRSCVAAG